MERYTLQANIDTSLIRHEQYEGKDYIVAPCVALVPGVLNQHLVTLETVSDTFQAWNGVPVTLTHPVDSSGQSVSANHPAILETYGLGRAWNFEIRDNKLFCEVWVNSEKAHKLGGDAVEIVRRLNAREPIEVSTGYWAYSTPATGTYNDRPYVASQHTIRPDHIALLPNDIGACNWADGCGCPRVNVDTAVSNGIAIDPPIDKRSLYSLISNAVSSAVKSVIGGKPTPPTQPQVNATNTDIKEALNALLADEMKQENGEYYGYCYVSDIDGDYAIVEWQGKLWRRSFASNESGVSFSGDWEEVQRMTQFVPVTNEDDSEPEEPPVFLPDTEEDQPKPEEDMDVEPEEKPVEEQEEEASEPSETNDADSEQAEEEPVVDTLQEFLQQNQVSVDDVAAALALRTQTRQEQISTIVANSDCTADDLQSMPDTVLSKMAKALTAHAEVPDPKEPDEDEEQPEPEPEPVQNTSYAGRGLPKRQSANPAIPVAPSILRKSA